MVVEEEEMQCFYERFYLEKGSKRKTVDTGDKLCNSPPVYNFSLTPYLRVSRSLRTADVSPSSSPLREVCYLSRPSLTFIFHLFHFINFTKDNAYKLSIGQF